MFVAITCACGLVISQPVAWVVCPHCCAPQICQREQTFALTPFAKTKKQRLLAV
jgi:hypothetical protein